MFARVYVCVCVCVFLRVYVLPRWEESNHKFGELLTSTHLAVLCTVFLPVFTYQMVADDCFFFFFAAQHPLMCRVSGIVMYSLLYANTATEKNDIMSLRVLKGG